MKKEKSPVLVISCILFLLLFIVLPPLFRTLIPKEEISSNSGTSQKVILLQCSKIFPEELYQVTARVRYSNFDTVKSNVITYQKLEQVPEGYQVLPQTINMTVKEEYSYLSNIVGVEKQENDMMSRLTISRDVTLESQDETLVKYCQDSMEDQQLFYEQMGYSCSSYES